MERAPRSDLIRGALAVRFSVEGSSASLKAQTEGFPALQHTDSPNAPSQVAPNSKARERTSAFLLPRALASFLTQLQEWLGRSSSLTTSLTLARAVKRILSL